MAKRYVVTHELHNMGAYTNPKLCQLTHYTLLVLRELANNCYNFSRIEDCHKFIIRDDSALKTYIKYTITGEWLKL